MPEDITVSPILLDAYPLRPDCLTFAGLPSMRDVFTDVGKAPFGAPVGISLTVTQSDNVMYPFGVPSLLISAGPGAIPTLMSLREAMRREDLLPAVDLAITAAAEVRHLEGVRWSTHGWQETDRFAGTHLRDLWIFPEVALLLDTIHECTADTLEDLAYLAIVLYQAPASNHGVFSLTRAINATLDLASIAAIPAIIGEWPQDVPKSAIPFAHIDPSDILQKVS